MNRTTHISYHKHTPEQSPYPCFIQYGRQDKTYTLQDIVERFVKHVETMVADPNVTHLRIGITLEEECHEMLIVDSKGDEHGC